MTGSFALLAATSADRIATPQVDWRALAPVVILLVGGIVLLTIASLTGASVPWRGGTPAHRGPWPWPPPLSVLPPVGPCAAVGQAGWITMPRSPRGPFSTVAGMVGVDGFGLFVAVVVCSAVVLGALLAGSYLRREDLDGPEFFVLLLLSGAGGVIMAMSNDFIVLFLGLETLSLAVYILAAMHLRRAQSQEAGMKYFVLGAFSSAFLLYGIALIYGATGSTNFIHIKNFFGTSTAATGVTGATCPCTTGCCWSAWSWCWWGWASRWQPCRSTPGSPTSTTGRPPRRWRSWPAR